MRLRFRAMRRTCFLPIIFTAAFSLHEAAAEVFLVRDGQPQAEIVIAEQPTRSQRLAAHELRANLVKISGARLPIVTQPTGKMARVFVGRSAHTDKLGISADGLQHGAFRMVTGEGWMALIGDDADFEPIEPWARSNGDIPRLQAAWENITHSKWGAPHAGLYKNRLKLPADTGKPDGVATPRTETLVSWAYDERGSFNAVCHFLHGLGARWYLPGELGEVLPSLKTIPVPSMDETVRPDFALRQFNFRFSTVSPETALWTMRLGMRHSASLQIAHGLETMTGRDAIFAEHPEWFALYGGRRDYTPGESKNQLCYSNEEFFRETVRFARAQLDQYKLESVSIMPPDGYTAICQCPKCEGKDSPERNERGRLSDYVWDFVNRVAREVRKTHPDRKVLNCAYGVYTLPPLKIDKLEPNVLVCIVGGRRPVNKAGAKAEGESAPEALRAAWQKKTDNPILIFENYPFTDRGWYLPSFTPHALGETVNATKGMSQGEDIWLSVRQDFDKNGIGFNHFQTYFTARMYWGGRDADVDAMFREYCRLFYGPAGQEMLAFFTHCEANWQDMEEDKAKADAALALFDKAKAKANGASVYGRRLALIDVYLKGLRLKTQQLAQKRGPVPVLRLVGEAKDIVIDGRLEDAYWKNCPIASTGRLWELQTGRQPTFGTTVKAGWAQNSVYFAIRCDEMAGEKPNIATTREGDPAIWYGDAVEFEIATETHSYYQIVANPAGVVVDLDRNAPASRRMDWDSQAEVVTHVADDHWTVEIRIPVTQDENDPLHQVIGRKPTVSLPWHVNVCRQRIREDGTELSALSPTGSDGFHVPLKFAYFYDGKSHTFDADASVSDFVIAFRAATQLVNRGKRTEALAAFAALAGNTATDFQKSAALEQAATLARHLGEFTRADELASRIPLEAVRKTAQMQNLLGQSKAASVIAQFKAEDIARWPFWKRGDGYHARGLAYAAAKAANEAESDLSAALGCTSEPRTRQSIWLALGKHREMTLKNDATALAAYRSVFAGSGQIGGADEFYAVQGAARLLSRMGNHAEALATLRLASIDKLKGTWRFNLLLSLGEIHQAAGHKEDARTAWKAVLDDPSAERRNREMAEIKLKSL